jgi:hypothetical protein
MVVQLPLPAQWARFESRRNPRDRLDQLHRDALDTKNEIRAALDRLAERHRIAAKDVAYAIDGYADNLLDDTIHNLKRELEREIEDEDPV